MVGTSPARSGRGQARRRHSLGVPALTPLRVAFIATVWIVTGLLLRFRLQFVVCGSVRGGWELAGYVLMTALGLASSEAVFDGSSSDDAIFRTIARLVGLAVAAVALSACVPLADWSGSCE